jgi:L-Ala-D/L-Glu epimerase / N-acetyl-D-glutamate racemase
VRLEVRPRRLHLRTPLRTAHGEVTERELLEVTLIAEDGTIGHGEAAPLPSYDGVTLADVAAALEDCRPVLSQAGRLPSSQTAEACRNAAVLPQAVAAIDLALWDIEGKRAGQPVWRLLGAEHGGEIEVNALIAADDRAGASRQAAEAVAAGFRCVKVKVGVGDDPGRLAAVRAAVGPETKIRIDANGAWAPDEAVAALDKLAPVGIELCEEPTHGVEALHAVQQQTAIPIAMDETTAAPGALTSGATQLACLKLSRCGGITGLLAAAKQARAAGVEVYLASTLDGPLGIAAALHAAAAIRPNRPSGLATLDAFADLDPSPLAATGGRMQVPDGPGLGAQS